MPFDPLLIVAFEVGFESRPSMELIEGSYSSEGELVCDDHDARVSFLIRGPKGFSIAFNFLSLIGEKITVVEEAGTLAKAHLTQRLNAAAKGVDALDVPVEFVQRIDLQKLFR